MTNDLSRQGSRTPLLQADDTHSLTSFPDPTSDSVGAPSPPLASDEHPEHALNGLLDGIGPSMFDEHEHAIENPQTLSKAPAEVIDRIIDYHGAADMIRRLSSLLAERDAHVSALIRLAEEFRIPAERISDATVRAQKFDVQHLSAALAAEEETVPSSSSRRSPSPVTSEAASSQNYATIRGFTKLFGGTGKRRESLQLPAGDLTTSAASSRSVSRVATVRARPVSLDVRSITSNESTGSWAAAIFGNGSASKNNNSSATTYGAKSNGTVVKRKDSRSTAPPREPVEMLTRHDRDQLPPTLVTSGKEPQDPQEPEWNRYLLRLTKHREQASANGNTEEDFTGRSGGELIGFSRFGTQGHAGKQKFEQLTRLVVGGIPMQLRHAIWMELSTAAVNIQPDAYRSYLEDASSVGGVDSAEIDAILKDVPRTLTSKYDFYADKGYDRLKRVLIAFVRKYPGLGYTQGLNMIAGYLLLAIPDESDAFWLLCTMVDEFFPKDYFAREQALSAALADNVVLRGFVKEFFPRLGEKLDALDVAPEHTVPLSWFLTAYASVLPATALLRVWDVWLCLPGHSTFLLNVALALLSLHQKSLLECETQAEYFTYMGNISGRESEESMSGESVGELLRLAWMLRKRLDGVEVRRALELKKLRRSPSTDALYSPESPDRPGHKGVRAEE